MTVLDCIQESWQVFDPFHPAGRRTLEWLIRECSGGRQLRALTMLVTLMVFVISNWVALLVTSIVFVMLFNTDDLCQAVTHSEFAQSVIPAITFTFSCGIKVAKRLPTYINNKQFGFLRATNCLSIRVEDRPETSMMTDRQIMVHV